MKLLQCYGISLMSLNRNSTKIKTPHPCYDPAYQRPFQQTLHTPCARLGRNPGMTSCCDKTQGCSIFCSLTQMKQSVCNNLLVKTASHRNQSINLLHKSIYWLYMTQVPAGSHQPTNSSMEIIKTPQRYPNIQKPLHILTILTAKLNLALMIIKGHGRGSSY